MVTNEELKEALDLNKILAACMATNHADELISAGHLTITKLIPKYSPARGAFAAFVRPYLKRDHKRAYIDIIAGVHIPGYISDYSELCENIGSLAIGSGRDDYDLKTAILPERRHYRSLYKALGTLEPRSRAIVERIFLDEEQASVVAKELGISRRLIYQWKAKALRHLRTMIEDCNFSMK